ncbi:MAG: isochorismatase family protein [Rhodospirillales bacterium]|nr:isochorismatase family protein [Rhodospirillales bacterium]
MLLNADRSVLLVIDVQERLVPAVADGEKLLRGCTLLVGAARRLDVPILVSEHYAKGLGRTVPDLARLVEPAAVSEKIHFCAPEEPGWAARFAEIDRPQAVICGAEAHVCVLQTALGLRARGYEVAVVADAVASRRKDDAGVALARMAQAGVAVVTSEMVVFEWLGRGDHPALKELLSLIK